MLIYRELKKDLIESSSLALGVFDGVHVGHREVISEAAKKAKELGVQSVIVTFSKHPRNIVSKDAPGILTSLEERFKLFEELGVDVTVVIDFNEELAKMTARDYFEQILIGCFNAKSITVGYNHKFGGDKKGNTAFLTEYCNKNGINLSVIPPVKIKNHTISSSVIRGLLSSGNIELANEFLGRPFKLAGEVIYGQQLGRKLGYPTANLDIKEDLVIPLRGVYSGIVKIDNFEYSAVINIGRKPTVGIFEKDLVEAHILDFNRDIYGQKIEVLFLKRLREEKKFDSLEELKKQIEIDCKIASSNNFKSKI